MDVDRASEPLHFTEKMLVSIGVFRDVERPVYDRLMDEQLTRAREEQGEGDLSQLLHAGDTWTIG